MTAECSGRAAALTCGMIWGWGVSWGPREMQPGELHLWGISLPGECGLFPHPQSRKRGLAQNRSSHVGVHSHFFRAPVPLCQGTLGCSTFCVRRGTSSFWLCTTRWQVTPSKGWKQTMTIKIPPADLQMSENSFRGLSSDLYKIYRCKMISGAFIYSVKS